MSAATIVDVAKTSIANGEPCVLCTVVRLDGSGYGRPGARLILTQSGEREGYISGGCLEKDLCRRVWAVTQDGPRLIAFDTRGNSVDGNRYVTGCEGVVYVLCQRIDLKNPASIAVLDAVNRHEKVAKLLTVYRSESPEFRIGDQWTAWPEDHAAGTCSGNNLSRLPDHVRTRLATAERNASISFVDDEARSVEAAIEVIRPRRQLVIVGAGDDVIPLVQAAAIVNWQVTVIGHRPELADRDRFPTASVLCGPLPDIARTLTLRDTTDVVVMTHDFDRDAELLPVLLESPVRSIGLLGPKRRLGNLVKRLYECGRLLNDDEIARLRCPIGLDIGAITPAEIAMSVMAELIALPNARDGKSLHVRREPLHEPLAHVAASTTSSRCLVPAS